MTEDENGHGSNGGIHKSITQVMNARDWRQLCQMVASEPDAHRLSELVDELLQELDRWKENGER